MEINQIYNTKNKYIMISLLSSLITLSLLMTPFSVLALSAVVTATSLKLRQESNIDSEILAYLKNNQALEVLEIPQDDSADSGWIKVKFKDKTGYVASRYVMIKQEKDDNNSKDSQENISVRLGVVKSDTLNMFESPNEKSRILSVLDLGTAVGALETDGKWVKIRVDGKCGYVLSKFLDIKPEILSRSGQFTDPGLRIVELAKRYLGIKYTWGGTTPKTGFDCSGLVYYIYRNFIGYRINRVAKDQVKQGVKIERNKLRPGDLVFFWDKEFKYIGHVGIYVGNNKMMHAPQTGGVVEYCDLDKYGERYYEGRRINAYPKFQGPK